MIGLQAPLPEDLGNGTPERPRLVVDLWLAVETAEGPCALMLLRAPDHGAFWQGVSGGLEPEDETLRAAALRELEEETGIRPAQVLRVFDLGFAITFESPYSGRTYRKHSLGAVLSPGLDPSMLALTEEHVEARVVSFAEARALVRWPENVQELLALEHRVQGRPGMR